ncbi:glycosyltransferase, partial [mine drainage metagenome]
MTIPSFHENFGMAIAEGLACGVPALVPPGLGIGAEILACGAGVPCGEDAVSISGSLSEALRDPDQLRTDGDNGRRWALETLAPGVI